MGLGLEGSGCPARRRACERDGDATGVCTYSNIGERRRRRRQCGRGGAACFDLFRVLTESLLQLQGARRTRRSGIGSERGGRSECGRTRNQRRATRAHVRHRRLMTNNGQRDRPRRAARTELEIDEQLRPWLETRLQQIIVVHHHKVSLALSEQRTRAGVAGALLVSGGEEQHLASDQGRSTVSMHKYARRKRHQQRDIRASSVPTPPSGGALSRR